MSDDVSTSKRDLVARVATLELLVADLIHALWRVDPQGMHRLADEAGQEIQDAHIPLPVSEQERERLFTVLEIRQRMLQRRKADA